MDFQIYLPPTPLIWTPRLLDFWKISHPPYYLDPPFIRHQRVFDQAKIMCSIIMIGTQISL